MARTHVVLSDHVMAAIDDRVGPRGRSRFLEEAAREKLERLALEESIRKTSGVLGKGTHPEWADRDSTRKWVRATRQSETEPATG